ncbi:ExbD/TolR family protein [Candidatus Neptunochlamydia vexilliferae]|uniref:ExbD/TolR family protein n=1 Tax=Candidatus Neptunichlamydia vexilliferae TaxID=1651774 RepID=UPI001E476B7A|nr:biopolymer transporter ExbD [Candidatus Neptunochlamydia vexilliferae]
MSIRKTLSMIHSEEEVKTDINLTPLIDVVFVVLILFILVAPLLDIDRVDLAPAGGVKKMEMAPFQETSPVQIHVYDDNSIWLNGNPLTIEELATYLRDAYAVNPGTRPQVYHDRKAYFGTYQAVKNVVEAAGYPSLDVILKPG